MTTTQQLVVGVFRDHAQAEQAVNELLQAGFDSQQIRFAEQGASAGGMLEKIKSMFTGQEMSASGIYDDLTNMGTPPEDARYYQSEYEAGRSIVAVLGARATQEAINIMVRHGGYGANQRFAQSADPSKSASAQVPRTDDAQREYNSKPVQQQQGARSMQEPQLTNTSNTYYNLVSVLHHALQAEQTSATYVQDAQQSGNQDLVQFFSEVQRNASLEADRAKQLLARSNAGGSRFSTQPQEGRPYSRPGDVYPNQGNPPQENRYPNPNASGDVYPNQSNPPQENRYPNPNA